MRDLGDNENKREGKANRKVVTCFGGWQFTVIVQKGPYHYLGVGLI